MLSRNVNQWLSSVPGLGEVGLDLARAVHNVVLSGDNTGRAIADFFHGTWLGHPLHAVLTDVVVGAWGFGTAFDLWSMLNGDRRAEVTADSLVTLGNYAALPTALAGLTDYSTVPAEAADTGASHAALNAVAYGLYLASARARKSGERDQAVALSAVAGTLILASTYLGGHMVYDQGVGVNHTAPVRRPRRWKQVLALSDLKERQPRRVQVAGHPVLLYRRGRRVMAIGAACAHAGGPLEKGDIYQDGRGRLCVQCPWHDSVYDLRNGAVVHGPSTYPVPNYHARVRDGQVEVRLAPKTRRAMRRPRRGGNGNGGGGTRRKGNGGSRRQRQARMRRRERTGRR